MGKSYKKTPITKDIGAHNYYKKYANRVVRQADYEDNLENKEYKKLFKNWMIHDYVCYRSEEDARKDYRRMKGAVEHQLRCWESYQKYLEPYPTEDIYIEKVWRSGLRK